MAEVKNKIKYLDLEGLKEVWRLLKIKLENLSFTPKTFDNYSEAMAWAKDPKSKISLGQVIYIKNQTVVTDAEDKETTYISGSYVVNKIGEKAKLSPLSTSEAGNPSLSETVNNIQQNTYTKTETFTKEETTKEITQIMNTNFIPPKKLDELDTLPDPVPSDSKQ